jgi:hypothetical protein
LTALTAANASLSDMRQHLQPNQTKLYRMDIVTDLTAEAVSYITLFQDILKSKDPELCQRLVSKKNWQNLTSVDIEPIKLNDDQTERIKDLIWHSPTNVDLTKLSIRYFNITLDLLQWLSIKIQNNAPPDKQDSEDLILFRPPFFWRQQIRLILYSAPEERITLVEKLRYMPLQIISVLAGQERNPYRIRLYQLYEFRKDGDSIPTFNDQNNGIFNISDKTTYLKWWDDKHEVAGDYLTHDGKLLKALKTAQLALPFETLFRDELIEITKAREARKAEWSIANKSGADELSEKPTSENLINVFDPLNKANEMQLMGIALSGGGIRSATFNLGVLQRLANLNVLQKFDYMSTVSGGGYIGSWLNSWISRSGSYSKVSDRLCPDKSGDPLADEVRPIRWLRMFSNYLSPNVGIMSPDAWASGMTWLRNAVINQAVLLLILLTVLSGISDIYAIWTIARNNVQILSPLYLVISVVIMLTTGSMLAAIAMRSFYQNDKKAAAPLLKLWEQLSLSFSSLTTFKKIIPHILVAWTCICALSISTYFNAIYLYKDNLVHRQQILLIVFVSSIAAFLFVAMWGNYHKVEVNKNDISGTPPADKYRLSPGTLAAIIISSVIASAAFAFLLVLFWISIGSIYTFAYTFTKIEPEKIMLVVGIPMVMEAFSIAVIIRMALMGNLFPDYRREWWGRVGGYIHRFILLWVIITFACLIMPDLWPEDPGALIPVAWGGWAGVIGWGVKKAFESKDDNSGKSQSITGLLVKVIPFLFMIGILLIGSWINEEIRYAEQSAGSCSKNIMITVVLFVITLLLSWRVGVNEFSLHHFYRNRLVRAFLGATRTREDRVKTANPFTGFDTNDDIKLSHMRVDKGYMGPFPIINAALNSTVVSALDRQDRMAESFIFSPLYCGYDFSPTRSSTYNIDNVYEYGYRPTEEFSNKNDGPTLGTAMAISGAAVSPNWGYHSSATMAFLMTLFNVRLGWWIGNPRLNRWKRQDPNLGLLYLLRDLIGKSDINMKYVCLSDGGHFDNMGLYELVRRRCSYILIGDGEQDQEATCEGFANAIRRCRIDFGVEIDIKLKTITDKIKNKYSTHIVKGEIIYPGIKEKGTLIYIKAALTGNEPVDIREYALANTDFPHETTADQFFDEAQFESYRKLGYHSISKLEELHLLADSKTSPS